MKSWNQEHPLQLELRSQLEAASGDAIFAPTRRALVKLGGLAGLGLAIGFSLAPKRAQAAPESSGEGFEPNGYIHVRPDGRIRIYAPNPEIGQGVKTSLPIIIVKELGARWEDIDVEQAPIDASQFGRQSAGGSRSIPSTMDSLRRAGATARVMLEFAAAELWQVPRSELQTSASRVSHAASSRSASFSDLSELASRQPIPNVDHEVGDIRRDFELGEAPIVGVDNEAIVTGQPLFGIDQRLPNMRYATYSKCPATGGVVKSYNREEILALPGVADAFALDPWKGATELLSGVAVIADSTWHALQAKKALKIEWDLSNAASDDAVASLQQAMSLADQVGEKAIETRGDARAAFETSENKLSASYAYPFLSHAPLEPQNCTAWYHSEEAGMEIWAPSQTPGMGKSLVAEMLGLAQDKVRIQQTRAGGGFGRRLANDYTLEAAAIARRSDTPIKLQWTREDDMAHDHYRAAGVHHFRAGIDAQGRLESFLNHHVSFTADGEKPVRAGHYSEGEFPANSVENLEITQTLLPWDTPNGFWRAPKSNGVAFAIQSVLHEISVAAGRDHMEFLMELLEQHPAPTSDRGFDPGRAKGVLRALFECDAALASSGARIVPQAAERRGQGIAFYFSHSGYVAAHADVSVSEDKAVRVHRVLVGVDVGPIVHESGARNQCEGSVIDALSTMMGLEVTCREGCIEQENFHQYPLGRISIAPRAIDVQFVKSGARSTGLGEPAFPPVAPAVCNAIFDATGQRLRQLPLAKYGYRYA